MLNGWQPQVLQLITATVHSHVIGALRGDSARVYLTGQSMGGNGAWNYVAQQTKLFAAVAVVCGYSLEPRATANRIAKHSLAVLVAHSADDSVIPVSASDDMARYAAHLRVTVTDRVRVRIRG